MPSRSATMPVAADISFYIALILAAFTIVFGTRHLDATERHEGMVAAIALESGVKLVAFLAVGVYVTYGIYDGFGDIFEHIDDQSGTAPSGDCDSLRPGLYRLVLADRAVGDGRTLSAAPVPGRRRRERQRVAPEARGVAVSAVSAADQHLRVADRARRPAAFCRAGGRCRYLRADLPMSQRQEGLALLVFIGGLSAATGMVIVETIALSTMVCNDLVMPLLMRHSALALEEAKDLSRLLLSIRRGAIVVILLLGYLYFRLAGEAYALVAIGLISFSAVAQFAPAMIGGMYWRGGTRGGALAGLSAGFLVWAYTCCCRRLPSRAGCRTDFLTQGPARRRAAATAATVRSGPVSTKFALPVLEFFRQHRRLCRRFAAAAANGGRGDAGDGVCRRAEGCRTGGGSAVARAGESQRPAGTGRPLSRPDSGRKRRLLPMPPAWPVG
jgi:hypothetical protein